MVPERMVEPRSKLNQVQGIPDNPVSGNYQGTVTLKKQWKHRILTTYLQCTMKPKGDGWAGNKA